MCDGIGGQPAGEAASQITAYAIQHLIRQAARRHTRLDDAIIRGILSDAAVTASRQLRTQSQDIDAIAGMGCTLVSALIDARAAFIVNVGDSAAFLCRDGKLTQLTEDHTRVRTVRVPAALRAAAQGAPSLPPTPPRAETDPLVDPIADLLDEHADDRAHAATAATAEATPEPEPEPTTRRFLTRFIGMRNALKPFTTTVPLKPGDRLLLCTDGLTDPVEQPQIREVLCREGRTPEAAAAELVALANTLGGPDNVTVTVIDYRGPRGVTDADRAAARAGKQATCTDHPKLRAALALVEQDLYWLQEHTTLTLAADSRGTLDALMPGDSGAADGIAEMPRRPHLESTATDAPWLARYSRHTEMLQLHLQPITQGDTRPSPLLTADESAAIFTALWYDWQRIEHRYLTLARRQTPPASNIALQRLLKHMLQSVRTLNGLLQFLPRYCGS